jgi:hypothetical protein
MHMPYDSNGNASVTRDLAVTGQIVQAAQVNVPFADIQAMLSQVVLRSGVAPMSGNLSLAGFKITNAANGSAPGDYVTMEQFNAAVSAARIPTGKRGSFFLLVPPTGWIVGDGRTIGNATSNATNRANADAYNLFAVFWSSFPALQIFTSAGAVSTRGASFDADWNASKALQVFDLRGEYDRGADAGRGVATDAVVGSAISDLIKSHAHGVTDNGHDHQNSYPQPSSGPDNDRGGSPSLFSLDNSIATARTDPSTTGISIQSFGGSETRPRTVSTLHCIKL